MIFVTVGTQLPFDRLIHAVDTILERTDLTAHAQIGSGTYLPKNMSYSRALSPKEFNEHFSNSTMIVSHAGIGSIISAMKHKKPIILFPRKAIFREHRNDHQSATCKAMIGRRGIYIADNNIDLKKYMESNLTEPQGMYENERIRDFCNNIKNYLESL